MELCRLCHLETLPNFYKNLFIDKTSDLEILYIIEILTGLKINENDPFPKLICCDCYGKLVSFYNFRELVLKADQRYHQEFSNTKIATIDQDPFENVDIKKEINENDRNSIHDEDAINTNDRKMNKTKRKSNKKTNGLLKKLLEEKIANNHEDDEATLPLLCEIKTEKDLPEIENNKINDTNQQLKVEIEDHSPETVKDETQDKIGDNSELNKCTQCGITAGQSNNICIDCEKKSDTFNDQISIDSRKCNQCSKVFVSLCNLKRHLSTVHSGLRLYLCNICGQSFAVNDTLQRHLKTHSDEKSYQCNHCGKCFVSKSYLTKHLNVHRPENLFACHICDRTFKQKSYLNAHLNVHFDNKRYNCNICNKQFSHKSNLNTHMRVHNGEKRFECDYCGKRFLVKCNLKKHLEVHNK